jgi:hypothetical protein
MNRNPLPLLSHHPKLFVIPAQAGIDSSVLPLAKCSLTSDRLSE